MQENVMLSSRLESSDKMIVLRELQNQTREKDKEILQQLMLFNALLPQKRLAEWMISVSREIEDPVLNEHFMKIAVNWYTKG